MVFFFLLQKLAEFSLAPNPRLIDGILLTKFDTIDDKVNFDKSEPQLVDCSVLLVVRQLLMFDIDDQLVKVGAALSMVYISGSPVMFVGCGQSYTDLKKLQVKTIVKTLLK